MPKSKKSIDNAFILDPDIAIYKNQVLTAAAEFIRLYLDNDISDIKNHFRHLLSYVSENIKIDKSRLNDIDYMKSIFQIYINLCDIYNINPSYGMFKKLYLITDYDIKQGLNNKYSLYIDYIYQTCKDYIIDTLSNHVGSSKNIQFIASSVYGLNEDSGKKSSETLPALSNSELLKQIGTIDNE